MILAGDIGGTKTNLAIFEEAQGGELSKKEEGTFASNDYAGLEAVIEEFLGGRDVPVEAAAFGVAGPVINGVSRITQLPWIISSASLQDCLGTGDVWVINDLEATAYGVPLLKEEQLVVLHSGEKVERGNMAVIAAGTGLGEAALIWDGTRYHAMASEGGHVDFAPRNELEIELLRHLLTKKHRISYERILSGPGLVNVYNFFKERGLEEEPEWLRAEIEASDDAAPIISRAALAGRAEICVRALDLFVTIYGAQAGNLALTVKATGGVFVGGGIAPKIIEKLRDGKFIEAYKDKGRLSPMVEASPVSVIMEPKTALAGAASYASGRRAR
ncbi:MAG TPA: glucokinase [Pyrinomonadaceae bacterium]|nr:glucokinase [Pyrinomonadaceae bacterium]